MTADEIFRRHSEERRRGFWRSPIVILDDRTAKDWAKQKSVVLVAHSLLPGGRTTLKAVRFDPTQVVSCCMNLEVGNMDIYEVSVCSVASIAWDLIVENAPDRLILQFESSVRSDGIFRGF